MPRRRRPWRLVVEQSDEVIDLDAWAKRYVAVLVRHQIDALEGDSHPDLPPVLPDGSRAEIHCDPLRG